MSNGPYQIEKLPEFDHHHSVSFIHDGKTGLSGFIAIHRNGMERPSFGATRFWHYESEHDALNDALRLSRMMSYKAALAGLGYGGAKAVIFDSGKKLTSKQRNALLKSYAQKINYLGGRFITGTDVGMTQDDIRVMAKVSPFFVGLKADPTTYTALGLYRAIKTCLQESFGSPEIRGRTFAVQGLGKIGYELVRLLYRDGGVITATDIDPKRIAAAKKAFPSIKIVAPKEIHTQNVDVFCPCALSHSLKFKNISKLRCDIIAGGANNQLEHENVGELLYKLGILYAPDYVVNAGGLISVVDEFEHKNFNPARLAKRVDHIDASMKAILAQSSLQKRATNIIANEMAQKIFNT